MNETKLEQLVPPVAECKAAYEAGVIGDTTALVWRIYTRYWQSHDVIDESRTVVARSQSQEDTVGKYHSEKFYPAPTLAELMAMLPTQIRTGKDARYLVIFDNRNKSGEYQVGYAAKAKKHGILTCEYKEHDTNPAAAALRLLVRVKQGEVKNADD